MSHHLEISPCCAVFSLRCFDFANGSKRVARVHSTSGRDGSFYQKHKLSCQIFVNLTRPVDALIVSLPTRARWIAPDEISLLKRKLEKSEQSVLGLKEHRTLRGTCPKDLRYDAKANIYPDEEFKFDIKVIRKETEQKFLHYRRIDRNQDKLRRAKSMARYRGQN